MAERITGHTELIGLMAYPIRHSSSPAMHNEAFAYLGLDYAYLAFEVDNSTLEDAVKGIRALKLVGSNVSMPNKTVVGQYLDKLSPAAELCGAVNTIVNENGVLTGHITDGIGFMQALKDNDIDVIGKKMTIAGAGGAATAIEIQVQAPAPEIPIWSARHFSFSLKRQCVASHATSISLETSFNALQAAPFVPRSLKLPQQVLCASVASRPST